MYLIYRLYVRVRKHKPKQLDYSVIDGVLIRQPSTSEVDLGALAESADGSRQIVTQETDHDATKQRDYSFEASYSIINNY